MHFCNITLKLIVFVNGFESGVVTFTKIFNSGSVKISQFSSVIVFRGNICMYEHEINNIAGIR